MNTLKRNWRINWELESLTYKELFNIFKSIIFKQFKTIKEEDNLLALSFQNDFQADSIDILSIILDFEETFNISILNTNFLKKAEFLSNVTIENLFTILYLSLLTAEKA